MRRLLTGTPVVIGSKSLITKYSSCTADDSSPRGINIGLETGGAAAAAVVTGGTLWWWHHRNKERDRMTVVSLQDPNSAVGSTFSTRCHDGAVRTLGLSSTLTFPRALITRTPNETDAAAIFPRIEDALRDSQGDSSTRTLVAATQNFLSRMNGDEVTKLAQLVESRVRGGEVFAAILKIQQSPHYYIIKTLHSCCNRTGAWHQSGQGGRVDAGSMEARAGRLNYWRCGHGWGW